MARRRSPNGFGSIRKKIVAGQVYYEGRYTDPILHKQKSVCAITERECRQKLKEVFAKITTGVYVTPNKKKIKDWAVEWLDSKENLKPGTRADYQRHIDQYINPQIGNIYVSDLRPIHCQEFLQQIKKPASASASSVFGKAPQYSVLTARKPFAFPASGYTMSASCSSNVNDSQSKPFQLPAICPPPVYLHMNSSLPVHYIA